MWVSTRAQYGLRALVEIALSSQPTSLKVVSERQNISQHYLEQIIAVLRRAGIVESTRGAYGGYRVARPLDQVSALEVVELMEGGLAPVPCIEDDHVCEQDQSCSTKALWNEVDAAVRGVLGATTLAHLVAERGLVQLGPLPEQFAGTN